MSKLAHSNQPSMDAIEYNSRHPRHPQSMGIYDYWHPKQKDDSAEGNPDSPLLWGFITIIGSTLIFLFFELF